MPERAIVPLRVPADQVPLATAVRGTVLTSSLAALAETGLEGAYFARLPAGHHVAIRTVVAQSWAPMELAMAHYGTLDALPDGRAQAAQLGRRVSDRTQGSYIRTVVQGLRAAGAVDPITVLGRLQAALDRLLLGCTAAVYQVGPKDCRVEIHGVPLARFEYVRIGWSGMLEAGLSMLARKVYVLPDRARSHATLAVLNVSWV
jgi:hypothetical protein